MTNSEPADGPCLPSPPASGLEGLSMTPIEAEAVGIPQVDEDSQLCRHDD